MNRFITYMFLLVIVAIPIGCSTKGEQLGAKKELVISAASSLTDALIELKHEYEYESDDVSITFNFGSSGKLATQIEQGAPVDIFLSASMVDMERLKDKALVIESTVVDFAENSLVLIVNKNVQNPITSFNQLTEEGIHHLSIGEPNTVPAGKYTKEALEHMQLWTSLQNKLVMGSDVRQVLTHVEMGNVDYGIVYATDAWFSEKVTVVAEANPSWHSRIAYPGAVVSNSKHQANAQDFLHFVAGEKGKEILRKYGFK
ncbi:molybdate ABC transporter substrate-binding protein [Sporosarcina sp. UB5]|uniref:molybdate ABC transporter substrate-binding protein n=1 Tax=Sporosarcina sp. UB5 TaxID=3047463 RepID=UPI003D791F56